MGKTIGRPMKYRKFIEILDDDTVYTPAAIVRHGARHGLLKRARSAEEDRQNRLRIRHSLARFSANHYFPKEGDGLVHLEGQAPLRGWLGRRWKDELY